MLDSRRLILPLALGLALAFPGAAAACTVTWDGGAVAAPTTWGAAANWSGDALPGPSDHVCIGAGAVVNHTMGTTPVLSLQGAGRLTMSGGTLSFTSAGDPSAIGDLTLSGGTLGGASDLAVAGAFTWSSGTLSGASALSVAGTLTLPGSGFAKNMAGRTLRLTGTGSISGEPLVMSGGAKLVNLGALTLGAGITAGVLENGGTLVRAGGGTAIVSATLQHQAGATLDVASGSLKLTGGGAIGAPITVASGATLDLGGGAFTVTTPITGAGTLQVSGGTQTISSGVALPALTMLGGTLVLDQALAPQTFALSGGTVAGSGALSPAAMSWSAGTLSGTGATTPGTLTMTSAFDKALTGRTLDLAGVATLAAGRLVLAGGAQVVTSGVLALAGSTTISSSGVGTALRTTGTGTLRVTGPSGTVVVSAPFQHDPGALASVEAGTLRLTGGSTPQGAFAVAAGATLDLNTGSYSLPTGQVSGAGTLQISGGTVTLAGAPGIAALTILGGSVVADAPVDLSALTLAGGSLTGSGALSAGQLTWSGGSLTGTGAIAAGNLALTGAVDKTLDGRVLELSGAGTISAGRLLLANAAQLRVAGTFSFAGEHVIAPSGALGLVHVLPGGTLRKSSGSGAATVAAPLLNEGLVTAQSGTLRLNGGAGFQGGGFVAGTGDTIDFHAGDYDLGGTLSGPGTLLVSGADVRAAGAVGAAVALSGGSLSAAGDLVLAAPLTWSGGGLAGPGAISADDVLLNGLAGRTLTAGRLAIGGDATMTGGSLTLASGSRLDLAGRLELTGDFPVAQGTGAAALLAIGPAGSLVKSGGAGSAAITAPVSNEGLVEARQGTLAVLGGLAQIDGTSLTGGSYRAASTLRLAGADIETLGAAVTLDGPSAKLLDAPTSSALRNLSSIAPGGALALLGGQALTLAGGLDQNGALRIGAGSALHLPAPVVQGGGSLALDDGTAQLDTPSLDALGGSVSARGRLSGALTLGPAATLALAVGGPQPLVAGGPVLLGGTLSVTQAPGSAPGVGERIAALTAPVLTGAFGALAAPAPAPGRSYLLSQGVNDVGVAVGAAPAAETGAASGITTAGATVWGATVANGAASTWRVEYGTSAAYGSSTPPASAPGGAVSAVLSGLAGGTTYHYRVVAESKLGAGYGADRSFTTAGAGPDAGGGDGSAKGPAAADRTAPTAALMRPAGRKLAAWKVLRGLVVDAAPSSGVARIEVSVVRRSGKRCSAYAGGRFVSRTCARATATWVRATLARGGRWSLSVKGLKPARYEVRVRARDRAGNVQKTLAAGVSRVTVNLTR